MGKEPEQTLFHTNSQHIYQKVLNSTNYQGNANQTTMKYHHLAPLRVAVSKKIKQVLTRMRRKGNTSKLLAAV